MRTTILALLALALATPLSAANITVTFNYDFTSARICSATVTNNCLDHFEVGILSGGGAFASLLSIPISGTPTGPVTGISGSFDLGLGIGPTSIAVIMVAKDGQGNRNTSDPSKCSTIVSVQPGSPSAISVAIK